MHARQSLTRLSLLVSCLGALLAGCGDDGGGGPDAARIDASPAADAAPPPDAAPPDAGPRPDGFPVTGCTPTSGTELSTEIVADSGLDFPVFVTAPPGDGRLFVVEKCGAIKIIEDGVVNPTPFLNLGLPVDNPPVDCGGDEEGLLGMAFHPDYADNGRFFVNYIEQPIGGPRNTIVAEYRVSDDPNLARTDEKRILSFRQPRENHNAGMLAFGPDGYLYIGTGDGGGSNDPDDNGQDTTTLLGSMLRIDVDGGDPYAIPTDNPYADSANGVDDPRPEIWAIGLRNPWRYSFDRETGDLYIGDVGQREWEEIDVQPATSTGGENYGWNEFEGTHCFPEGTAGCDPAGMTMPVAEYAHDELPNDKSVSGGYVYRGACMPDIQGWYFYADYGSHAVRSFEYSGGQAQNNRVLSVDFGQNIVSFGEDAAGELYVVNVFPHRIRKIVPASTGQ